jgi:uncharacterized protein
VCAHYPSDQTRGARAQIAEPRSLALSDMTTTIISRAQVATAKPVPYMRQLCKHFGHKLDASFDDDSGYIQFDFGRCELQAVGGELLLTVSAADDADRERMENVVGSHLERFGKRDELNVTWTR